MEELESSMAAEKACRLVKYYPAAIHLDIRLTRITSLGVDLAGTTFWEFKDSLNANRMRRIAKHNRKTQYSDIQTSRTSFPQSFQNLEH